MFSYYCAIPQRLSHHTCLCDGRLQEKNINRERSRSDYISRMRGGDRILPMAMTVRTFFRVTDIMTRANLGAYMRRGLNSAKGRI